MKNFTFSPMLSVLILAALGVTAVGYVYIHQFPQLQQSGVSIDQYRATILLTEQRRSTIQSIKQELLSVQAPAQELDQEVWSFAQEDSFFQLWSNWAAQYSLDIPAPQVAEVTPAQTALQRPATITATGSLANLEKFWNAIQAHQPLLGITQVSLQPGPEPGTFTSVINLETVWK